MEIKKFKQIPSINRIGSGNPRIPAPVIISRGVKNTHHERTLTRSLHTNIRALSPGEPINWDEVYN